MELFSKGLMAFEKRCFGKGEYGGRERESNGG